MTTERTPEIALCAAGELFGGVERHLLGMCAWLRRHGHRPRLVLMHDRELAAQARAQEAEVHILEARHSWDPWVPRKLARHLVAEGVNIVHCHGERAAVNAALAQSHSGFAIVRTMHGAIEPSPLTSLTGVKDRLYPWLERVIAGPRTATVCYVTEDLRRLWRAEQRGEVSLVVHNGLDPLHSRHCRRPPGWGDDEMNLVIIGRVSAVKGIPFAIEAMARLRDRPRLRLHIIGSGPTEDECRRMVSDADLGERVLFHGFRQDIHDFMAHADALLMPSLHEGLPYTILEAMSLAVPIIASAVGGLREILKDGDTARLVPVGDVAALTSAITALQSDPAGARAMGVRAQAYQAAHLDLEQMGSRLWALYERVLRYPAKIRTGNR